MSFELVRQLQEKAVPVDQTCRLLEVSRSGYYAARRRRQVQPAVCEASVQLKAAFVASGRVYGSRRLRTAMAARGVAIGIYRLRRLMRQHGLRSAWKRKFVHRPTANMRCRSRPTCWTGRSTRRSPTRPG